MHLPCPMARATPSSLSSLSSLRRVKLRRETLVVTRLSKVYLLLLVLFMELEEVKNEENCQYMYHMISKT